MKGVNAGWLEQLAGWLRRWAVVLGPLVLFGPDILQGKALFWGTPLLQFVPWREFALQTLRAGHLPLWNPLLGMGAPLVANYQSALFYPPNWLLAVTGVAWGHGLLVVGHLILAGWGMQRLAAILGVDLFGQRVAALAFQLSGYLVARSGFLSINAAAAWLPWELLAVELALNRLERGDRRAALRAALLLALAVAAQLLAGHAQTTWYSLVLLAAWVAWRGWRWDGLRGLLRSAGALLLAVGVAVGLAAIQLLPTLEYLLQSQRAGQVDRELALTYSFWPWRLLGLLMPDLFGNPAHGDYWGYANYWEDAIYIGLLPLLLLVLWLGWRRGRGGDRGLVAFLLAVAGAAFLLALGANTPLFPWLYDNVPTFDLFQAPTRWNLLTVFALALLAGMAAESWQRESLLGLKGVRLGIAGGLAVAASAKLFAWQMPGLQPSFLRSFVSLGLLIAAAGGLALLKEKLPARLWQAAVLVLLGWDLVSAGRGLNPMQPLSLYRGPSSLAQQVDPQQRVWMPSELERHLKFDLTHRFDRFAIELPWRAVRDMGLPNTTMLDGISSANNFDPLLPARYVRFMEGLEGLPTVEQRVLLRSMNVGAVALADPQSPLGVRYERLEGARRAWLVPAARWVSSADQGLELLFSGQWDPARSVLLEGDGEAMAAPRDGTLQGEVKWIVEDDPGRVVVDVRTAGGAWLVVADAWYPGWRARVDGRPAPLYVANYLFRALRVPAGEHRVEMVYRPASFGLGALLTGLAGMLWMLGWLGMRRGANRSHRR